MKAFHGSNIDVESVNLILCRKYTDFGKGFYLSFDENQAQKRAAAKANAYGGSPIADDNMRYLFRNVRLGQLTIKELVEKLTYQKPTMQICFRIERSLKLLKKI